MNINNSIKIRVLTRKDLDILNNNLAVIDDKSIEYKDLHPRLHSVVPIIGCFEESLSKMKRDEETCLIAWINSKPVGCIFIRWIGDHDIHRIVNLIPASLKYKDIPAFYNFWVSKDYRSKGIGSTLIKKAEKIAYERNYPMVGMTVDDINHQARRLYEYLGYKESEIGLFQTSGKYFKKDRMIEWINGPMCYLYKDL